MRSSVVRSADDGRLEARAVRAVPRRARPALPGSRRASRAAARDADLRSGLRHRRADRRAAPELEGARDRRDRQLRRDARAGSAGPRAPVRAAGHQLLRSGGEGRPDLQQRGAALGPRPRAALRAPDDGARARRPARGADADDRRPPDAPDRLGAGPVAHVPPPPRRLPGTPTPAGAGAVRELAASPRPCAAARPRRRVHAPARIARGGARVGAGSDAHRLPEAASTAGLDALPRAVPAAPDPPARRRAALLLHVPSDPHLGRASGGGVVHRAVTRLTPAPGPDRALPRKLSSSATTRA